MARGNVIKRIAVLTTGGDAPGMNAAIRTLVRYGIYKGLEVMGVFRGWWGLINEEIKLLDSRSVSGIINQGGTILKTSRCPQFQAEEMMKRAFNTIRKYNIDGMIIIGGNGSFTAAHNFCQRYMIPCIGIAATIDNDVNGIDMTFGVDTTINTALDALDKIRDTATSMERIFVVEVMGRKSGFIALSVALAGGCEEVIIPEREYNLESICHDIVEGNLRGKISWIILVAEGAGSAENIAKKINEMTDLETRAVVLGYIQRGGKPTAITRRLAILFAQEAVEALLRGETEKAVGFTNGKIVLVDFAYAIQEKKWDPESLYKMVRILT